jgi:hypothetical protein
MKKTITTIALVTLSGSAFAQSGLDIDRAYAAELRADASTRSSLLGSAGSSIDAEIFTQFRYTYDNVDEVGGSTLGDNDTIIGFSTPRTQIRLSGGVEGTDITGHVSFDFGGAFDHGASGGGFGDGGATLRDAYASWGIDDNWTFLFGQMKNPFNFESNVAPEHSQGVERSITNSFFDVGYTQGIALNYSDDEWKFTAVISDGIAAANSYYTSGAESDFSITGRLDWLISGNWDQFSDFASWQGSNTGFRVGAGLHWSQAGDTFPAATAPGGIDTATVTAWTVDAQYEGDGWGIFASYQSTNLDNDFVAGGVPSGSADQTDDGLVIQANMFFTEQFEAFARYDMIILDDDLNAITPLLVTDDDAYSTFTVGFNYYLVPESYAARFSMDVSFGLDDTSGLNRRGFTDVPTTGYVGTGFPGGVTTESDLMIRGQFSLLF